MDKKQLKKSLETLNKAISLQQTNLNELQNVINVANQATNDDNIKKTLSEFQKLLNQIKTNKDNIDFEGLLKTATNLQKELNKQTNKK